MYRKVHSFITLCEAGFAIGHFGKKKEDWPTNNMQSSLISDSSKI
jgi:hypothetical protein